MKRQLLSFFLLTSLLQPPFVSSASAAGFSIPEKDLANGFNPHAILTDDDIFDVSRMDLSSIRHFLNSKGVLNKRLLKDIDGIEKEPSEIIFRIANSYKLNPQYLLVLLQKEQSLVEAATISDRALDWATGFGVCDDCSKDDPRIQDFKGFANQLEYAAKQHRERYLMQLLGKGSTISGHAPGKTVMISGMSITPANNATAMLYTYTPHIHGNLNLWRIWKRWFSLDLPDGTIVQTPENTFYLIRFGVKRAFESRSVALSMVDASKIIQLPEKDLLRFPDGAPIKFPNYAIVETPSGTRYLLVDTTKRLIQNTTVFKGLGFVEDDVLLADAEGDLDDYVTGPDITSVKQYPTGLLVQDPSKSYWYIQDGARQPIHDPALLSLYFKGRKAKLLTNKQLESYILGKPYALRDGELVRSKSSPAVFVVEHGLLRPILSGEVFERIGWQWRNVITVNDSTLKNYTIGEPINGISL